MGQVTRQDGRKLFENTTDGSVGVTVLRNGEEKGLVVRPRAKVWLSDDEIEMTVHAHLKPSDSPFEPQEYELRGPDGQVYESGHRPLLVAVEEKADEEQVVADGPTSGEAPEGELAPGEEVGGAPADDGRLQDSSAIGVPPPAPVT